MNHKLKKKTLSLGAFVAVMFLALSSIFYTNPAKADIAYLCRYTGSYQDACTAHTGYYIINCVLGLSTSCGFNPEEPGNP